MRRQSVVLTVVLLTGCVGRFYLGAPRPVPKPQSLSAFPSGLQRWEGRDAKLPDEVLQQTGADDFLNRYYEVDNQVASLYVAYYRSQRQGAAIHSPMNCLPGAGWQPLKTEHVALGLDANARPRVINKVIVVKGLDQQLVLYWYQTATRVTASEYWSKAYLVGDAFRSGRTDIALVRIIVPLEPRNRAAESRAFEISVPFAQVVLPIVQKQLFGSL